MKSASPFKFVWDKGVTKGSFAQPPTSLLPHHYNAYRPCIEPSQAAPIIAAAYQLIATLSHPQPYLLGMGIWVCALFYETGNCRARV